MKKEPALIQSLQKASMDKGRSRFFLVFLLLSFFFGSLPNFRKPILRSSLFSFLFATYPVAIVRKLAHPLEVETTLSATGFQFLYYRFIDKELAVDLGEANLKGGKASVQLAAQFQELQEQLLGDTQIVNYFPTVIEFDYERQLTKRLPVLPQSLNLALGLYGCSS